MPSISYAKGQNELEQSKMFISKRLKKYLYITALFTFICCLTYKDLISLWTGPQNYAGFTTTYLLAALFFVYCIGYFLINIGYALGDFKTNSFFSILKCSLVIIFTVIGAHFWGVNGVLALTLVISLIIDVIFYGRRLMKMKYLLPGLIKSVLRTGCVLIPVSVFIVLINDHYAYLVHTGLQSVLHLCLVSLFYLVVWAVIIYLSDKDMQDDVARVKITMNNKLSLFFKS
jgi:O-antigen/teichoic acid export membrane protein